jgi:hypothetical protein
VKNIKMKINALTSLILILLIIIIFLGCIEEDNSDIKLNNISLQLEDLNGNYSVLNEEYITEPYIVEEGMVLQGLYALEKYEIVFNSPNDHTIDHTIVKFSTNKDAIHAIERTINNYTGPFDKIDTEPIGDMVFYAKNTSFFGENKSLYLMSFSKQELVIVLFGTSDNQQDFIDYANIINTKITDTYNEL